MKGFASRRRPRSARARASHLFAGAETPRANRLDESGCTSRGDGRTFGLMFRHVYGGPSSEDAALALCRASVDAGRYILTEEAQRRFHSIGLALSDVRHVLQTARSCVPTSADDAPDVASAANVAMWTAIGTSIDGGEIALTLAFDGDLVMVL
jgi:hypothetical protein